MSGKYKYFSLAAIIKLYCQEINLSLRLRGVPEHFFTATSDSVVNHTSERPALTPSLQKRLKEPPVRRGGAPRPHRHTQTLHAHYKERNTNENNYTMPHGWKGLINMNNKLTHEELSTSGADEAPSAPRVQCPHHGKAAAFIFVLPP